MSNFVEFPKYTALDCYEPFVSGTSGAFSHSLKTEDAGGIHDTRYFLKGAYDGTNLSITVADSIDAPGLFYNIFAILISMGDETIYWNDPTVCGTSVPQSISPGRSFTFKPVKLPAGQFHLHIIVWGYQA